MKACRQNILLCSTLLLQITLCAYGEGISYKRCSVKTLNYEQGLLNNSTTDIVTDANGFTWVSTFTGLQRYNGYFLETINPVVNNLTIKINYPVHFLGLEDGSIWMSYKEGVLHYSPVSHTFSKIIAVHGSSSFFSIVPLKETASGIWCIQQGAGIVLFSKSGEVVNRIALRDTAVVNGIFGLRDILFRSAICSNHRFIFVRTNEKSILQIDIKNGQYQILSSDGFIYALGCNADQLYMISDKGLFNRSFDENASFKNILSTKLPPEKISYGAMARSANGKMLFSINRHFYQMDGFEVEELTQLNKELLLSTGVIQKIYADKLKRIWLLTNNDIKRIQEVDVPFDEFSYPNEKNNFIRCIYFDKEKHLVIAGCYNGAVQLYDTNANPMLQQPIVNAAAGYILSIEKLSAQEYLLYTFESGLFTLNLKEKTIRDLPFLKDVLSDNNFENNMQRINDSTILISTSKNIYRCLVANGHLAKAEPLFSNEQIANEKPGCFIYNSYGTVWTGTITGNILKLDKYGNFEIFPVPENYVVRSITQTNSNRIWVGTEQALYVFDTIGKSIKSFTRKNGLLNDCIYALLPAGDHDVFCSSNFGLSYVNENGTIKNFTKELGLQENEFNTGAAIKTSAGKFFFGGVNGISAFYPLRLSESGDQPVLNITRFIVNDSLVNPTSNSWRGDTLTLKYNQNRLQLDFAALGVFNNTDYLYTYRLKGFEQNWQQTHEPTGIKYNLTPGTYTLEIICNPMLSFSNSFKKNFTIVITPPFWKTWWFETTAFLFFIGVVFFSVRYYNRRKYVAKIRELQSQQKIQQERERISRELHDNIGSQLSYISSNIDWLIDRDNNMEAAEKIRQMNAVNQSAKNIMSNLRETIWALHKESISLSEFSDKLKSYIMNVIQLKPQIKFTSEEHIEENIAFSSAETLNIFRVCQEVVNNIIKHADATMLKLSVYSDEKKFCVIIEDNGKGFNAYEKKNGHYGLENIKFRAKELDAELLIRSEASKGTSVSISRTSK